MLDWNGKANDQEHLPQAVALMHQEFRQVTACMNQKMDLVLESNQSVLESNQKVLETLQEICCALQNNENIIKVDDLPIHCNMNNGHHGWYFSDHYCRIHNLFGAILKGILVERRNRTPTGKN